MAKVAKRVSDRIKAALSEDEIRELIKDSLKRDVVEGESFGSAIKLIKKLERKVAKRKKTKKPAIEPDKTQEPTTAEPELSGQGKSDGSEQPSIDSTKHGEN